jgi:hypothetical protein
VRVKGHSFHSVIWALGELRGEGFKNDVLEHVPGAGGLALREKSLLSSNWYPVEWYRDVFATAVKLAPGVPSLARDAGRLSGGKDVRGVYRIMFRLLATETMIRQSPRLFRLFYDGGEVSVLEVREGFARVRYAGCDGFDRNVWHDLVGGSEAVFEATGAKGLRIRIEEGGGDGDSHMLGSVVWT